MRTTGLPEIRRPGRRHTRKPRSGCSVAVSWRRSNTPQGTCYMVLHVCRVTQQHFSSRFSRSNQHAEHKASAGLAGFSSSLPPAIQRRSRRKAYKRPGTATAAVALQANLVQTARCYGTYSTRSRQTLQAHWRPSKQGPTTQTLNTPRTLTAAGRPPRRSHSYHLTTSTGTLQWCLQAHMPERV